MRSPLGTLLPAAAADADAELAEFAASVAELAAAAAYEADPATASSEWTVTETPGVICRTTVGTSVVWNSGVKPFESAVTYVRPVSFTVTGAPLGSVSGYVAPAAPPILTVRPAEPHTGIGRKVYTAT